MTPWSLCLVKILNLKRKGLPGRAQHETFFLPANTLVFPDLQNKLLMHHRNIWAAFVCLLATNVGFYTLFDVHATIQLNSVQILQRFIVIFYSWWIYVVVVTVFRVVHTGIHCVLHTRSIRDRTWVSRTTLYTLLLWITNKHYKKIEAEISEIFKNMWRMYPRLRVFRIYFGTLISVQ